MNKLMQTGKWGCQAGIWKYETRGSGERFKLEIKNQEEKRRASQWLEAGEIKNIQEKKCLRENSSRGRGECDSLVPQWRKCSRKDRVVKVLSAAPKSSLMGPPLDLGPRGYWRPQRREFQEKRRKAFERMKEEPEERIKDSECRHLSWEDSLHGEVAG